MLLERMIHNSFLLQETELLNEYDRLNFQNSLQFYKEGAEEMLASIINTDGSMYCEMIDQTMEHLRESTTDIKEIINFFEGVYNSPSLDEIPITSKVYNLSSIDKIRPQYLEQISNEIGLTIDRYLSGKITKHDVDNTYFSDTYLTNCKKNMVRTSIPYNLNAKDLAKYDVGTICEINREFLSTTALPFLRNVPQYIKELEVTSANVTAVIRHTFDDIKVYTTVVDKMLKENKISIDDYRFLNKYLYKAIRTFMQLTSYLSFIMIKKITIVSASINRYKELHVKILNYFPEGDTLLHESAIDGSLDDLDMGALVHDILQNNNSLFRSVLRSIVNRERGDLAFCFGPKANDDHHSMIDLSIDEYEYPIAPYHNALNIFKVIETGFNTIEANLKDPYISFEEILDKSGFQVHIGERFTGIINQISNTNQYDTLIASSNDLSMRKQVYFMMIHELSKAESHMDDIVMQIRKAYDAYELLESRVNNGDTLEIANRSNIEELHVFLKTFDADFRQLVLTVMREFISRIRSIDHSIKEIDDHLFTNADISDGAMESVNDFYDFLIESTLDIQESINEVIFESYLREYNQVRTFYETGVRIVYEDGEQKTFGGLVKDIINKIKEFFTKSDSMMGNIANEKTIMKGQEKTNLQFLQDNKEALLNRNFNGVTINVLPYEKYFENANSVLSDIDKVKTSISNLNRENIKKLNTVANLNGHLFSFMGSGANTDKIGDLANKYYKVKNGNLEVMPYANAEAKRMMGIMLDYCIEYYSTFRNDLKTATDQLVNVLDSKLATLENLNESTYLEAEGEAKPENAVPEAKPQTTTTNIQTTEQKANTKATVQVDKSQDSSATVDGKKVETDSTTQIIKWLSSSVQQYSAAVMTCAKARNYDYIKIIKPLIPKQVLQAEANNQTQTSDANTTQNTQQTETNNNQQNQQTQQ